MEIYYFLKKKFIEIWNIVNIKFIKKNNFIYKLKNNIIDSGLGNCRINSFKKKNLKLYDICNTIYLIKSSLNLNFTKNHFFLLKKLLKIIYKLIFKKKISIFKIFYYFFKKNKKFYFKNNIFCFFNFIIKKEFYYFLKLKKINIKKINLKNLKNFYNTHGFLYDYSYKIIKNIYK